MDQQKIGAFLKELRKEKNITQEQLADEMRVSRRTVSRWETGSNMPDMDILIDISDFYGVDLREILDGKRKEESMDKEMKETVLKVAEYGNEEKESMTKRFHMLFIVALVFLTVTVAMIFIDLPSQISDFMTGLSIGVGYGMVVLGVIMTSRYAKKIRDFKRRIAGLDKGKSE